MLLALLLACSTDPTIRIVTPEDGAVVCNAPLVVVTEVENFTLVAVDDTEELPGTGHIDLAINGQEALDTMFAGEVLTVPEVEAGFEYQLKVELSNADHTPIEPYAGDFIYVTAEAEACE